MKPYSSIETTFKRDHVTNLLDFETIRLPMFEVPRQWEITEKIDGTNIRVIITHSGIEVRGRTDNAQLNHRLIAAITATFPSHEHLVEVFSLDEFSAPVTFYGEGYGAGIQKGGAYSATPRFRAFDLRFGEVYRDPFEMRRTAQALGVPTVPFLGVIDHTDFPTTREALHALISESIVAIQDSGTHGVLPEGIVARPPVELLDKYGNRLITKLTYREFKG